MKSHTFEDWKRLTLYHTSNETRAKLKFEKGCQHCANVVENDTQVEPTLDDTRMLNIDRTFMVGTWNKLANRGLTNRNKSET